MTLVEPASSLASIHNIGYQNYSASEIEFPASNITTIHGESNHVKYHTDDGETELSMETIGVPVLQQQDNPQVQSKQSDKFDLIPSTVHVHNLGNWTDPNKASVSSENKTNFRTNGEGVSCSKLVNLSPKESTETITRTKDVRPKVFASKQFLTKKTCQIERQKLHSDGKCYEKFSVQDIKKEKRVRPTRHERADKKKKWKPVHLTNLGFFETKFDHQLYLLKCDDDENKCENENDNINVFDDINTASGDAMNEMLMQSDCQPSCDEKVLSESSCCTATGPSKDTNPNSHAPDSYVDESVDDVAYFRNMGIDIYDDGTNNDDFDDILEWDGVRVHGMSINYEPIHTVQSVKTSKPTNKTKDVKNNIMGTSSKLNNKRVQDKKYYSSCEWQEIPQLSNISKYDRQKLFELECCSSSFQAQIRRDRHRSVQKAHKAVKSKNIVTIFNNPGKKLRYMHHRLVKRHGISLDFRDSPWHINVTPMSKWNSVFPKKMLNSRPKPTHNRPTRSEKPPPVQNLKHAIHESNTPNHLEGDLVGFLISLQHRELSPEDYEMLLRLDDTVKPKTVSQKVIDKLKTEIIGPDGLDIFCVICMEPYVAGQVRKFLPCDHDFHKSCIETWLTNSSMNCPLDGLPLDSS